MALRALAALGVVASLASGNPLQLQPRELLTPLGPKSTAEQLKWSPALDYDTDSCYNVAAINSAGTINAGQSPSKGDSEILKYCRKEERLAKTNVYVRSRCSNGWCAHVYDYYFEADRSGVAGGAGSHRHDWEHIVVWVQDNQARYIQVSQHSRMDTRKVGEGPYIGWEQGTHVKVVYHRDGLRTHAFRFASKGDEPPENHWKSWRWGAGAGLLNWDEIPGNLREKLSKADFGSASMVVKNDPNGDNWNFRWWINWARDYCDNVGCYKIAPEYQPGI
ncbi:necrosis inducing protein-domain-containing protein [Immersiella caudata]|uniref:Necrosis inducing protein-domain-containing protein n=1 Tax=Immersiella caudata TaxID=314043 RepID=A0AA39WDD0_9PEZI|nr:necrosis inducing protein-domain-containing protein [Immersiella caudata]